MQDPTTGNDPTTIAQATPDLNAIRATEIAAVVAEAVADRNVDFLEGLEYGLILAGLRDTEEIQRAWASGFINGLKSLQGGDHMLTKVAFYLSDEDRRNLERIRRRHPGWSVAMIFRRALGLYASNLAILEPLPKARQGGAQQAIEELFGPQ